MSIKLDGINQTSFTPVKGRKYLTQLPAGEWIVGKDIKPGRYTITAISGNGNLTSNDGDINEILGTTADQDAGQVTSVTKDLHKGEVITSDIQEINLSANN